MMKVDGGFLCGLCDLSTKLMNFFLKMLLDNFVVRAIAIYHSKFMASIG